MRQWALILHFYQPPTQSPGLTDWIRQTCYQPLVDLLSTHSQVTMTLNISGSLLLQLKQLGSPQFFETLKILIDRQQVELLQTPIYHPLLPLTPQDIVLHQIEENNGVLKTLGIVPTFGFFPPELAIDSPTLQFIAGLFPNDQSAFTLIDESSLNPNFDLHSLPPHFLSRLDKEQTNSDPLNILTVSRSLTEILRSSPKSLSASSVVKFILDHTQPDQTIVSLNDAEIFGHHYAERIDLLKDLFDSPDLRFIKASDISASQEPTVISLADLHPSTWQTSRQDLKNDCPYPLWHDPQNNFHIQYQNLSHLAFNALHQSPPNDDKLVAQNHFDRGISSCHAFWLSRHPWWHPQLAEAGATELIKAIRTLPVSKEDKNQAEKVYHDFLYSLWEFH